MRDHLCDLGLAIQNRPWYTWYYETSIEILWPTTFTYVFSCFFRFSDAREFWSWARAASATAVAISDLFVDETEVWFGVALVVLVTLSFLFWNMARNWGWGLASTFAMPLLMFGCGVPILSETEEADLELEIGKFEWYSSCVKSSIVVARWASFEP